MRIYRKKIKLYLTFSKMRSIFISVNSRKDIDVMKFSNKTKRVVCICLAAAMIVPIVIGAVFTFVGM